MNSSNQTKDIIEGFEDDFIGIVEDFAKSSSSMKVKDFFKFWGDNHMDMIFANRFDPRELLEAISEINKKLVEVTINSTAHDQRLVALYMMLCLYVKQPSRLRRKIRLTCDDVICLKNFSRHSLRNGLDTDAKFALERLFVMKAIDVVEERDIFGPSMIVNKGARRETESVINLESNDKNEALDFISQKIEPTLLELDSMVAPYESIKCTLDLDSVEDPTVDVKTNGTIKEFVDEAKNLLFQFKAKNG